MIATSTLFHPGWCMKTQSLAGRIEGAVARGTLNLPAALLRILAGQPVVRDGQTLDDQTQTLPRMQRLRGSAALGGPRGGRRARNDGCTGAPARTGDTAHGRSP
jgi:acetyl esterase